MRTLELGLERCLRAPPARLMGGARFGLLLNQASVDRAFGQAHRLLAARFPGQLVALFGPQHGLHGEQQDDMVETGHAFDHELGVPVHSLYAERREPTAEMLAGLDVLVVDLQDVGCRVYTYAWTLLLCMRACARAGVALLVLDRPNPLGALVEGPVQDRAFRSFVGLHPVPMRHGLTLGELARLFRAEERLDLELDVLPCRGLRREQRWPELGRPWVPTSPNLPRFEGALLYPGLVLVEGTELSEGRGTTTPFEQLGAPWLEPMRWRAALAPFAAAMRGAVLRPVRFEPTFQKHAGASCGGLFVHPVPGEEDALRPYALGLALIATAQALAPERSIWRQPPYEYEQDRMPFDLLSGDARARTAITRGLTPEELQELCHVDFASWVERSTPYLLYEGSLRDGSRWAPDDSGHGEG